jgi:ribonucleoside-diphosphate reductase beta chain
MNIFSKRDAILPYEYPTLNEFGVAILHSFWQVDKFPYERDIRDYKISLTDTEREAVKRAMLAISVVENKVKKFWAHLPSRMDKVEVSNTAYIFSSNECVHQLCYQRLLERLNLQEEFETVLDVPCMKDRVKYLTKYLDTFNSRSNKEFTKSLILFTLMVENCSLFTQFYIISSFSKYKNVMKNFADIITATMKDEQLHGNFGAALVKVIRDENPDWFDQEMHDKIVRNVHKAYDAECKVLDWIFENGELDFVSKAEIQEFLKSRLNDSLYKMGYTPLYTIDPVLFEKAEYLDVLLKATPDGDFFDGKLSDYAKSNSFEEDSLWD